MSRYYIKCIFYLLIFLIQIGCDKSSSKPDELTYKEIINQAWSYYVNGQYSKAYTKFIEARSIDSDQSDAYTGLGWCLLKMDNIAEAEGQFNEGSYKSNISVDLFAGWAFVLNIEKEYSESNSRAELVLNLNPAWQFPYNVTLDIYDLNLIRAENYYLLSEFGSSLAIVQLINPSFNVDVTTSDGRAGLAEEIERLLSLYLNV